MQQAEIIARKIAEIRPRFLADLSARLDRFDALRDEIDSAADARPLLDELMQGAHRIAGLAATMGFGDLGQLSRQTELAIQSHRSTSALRPPAALLDEIDDLLGEMALIVQG
ncbi:MULTISPECIES: Hpt domain-containing protein [Gemmobacter]|jgi:HPt (histidine-containing phosphotransfer) domain-containing protein|uniref:Hpt domain-containing protein n=2 Tax=Gemmobacter TaxID=204456 RepID=A0A2T6AXG2_9RHOB|nr:MULTISPECIES: Hpt domain-containing protein [Gemmobacter]OJY28655.1 MAG: hypothetical protein BGP11_18850 [Rhodobacterales bacterium 65-51]PTX48505.1 Hpt domain-containing protein [Gemmobacter caeni]TWI99694.1 Hpt domain-containing protein [Gemmobacter caeni]GHC09267.1 hypothetical protein GCM10007291_01690 [Gemmobacter nanjingensis]